MNGDELLKLEGKRLIRVVCHNSNNPYGYGLGFDLVGEDGITVCVEPLSVGERKAVMKIRELQRVRK
jgi:hypothetical protein